MDSCQISVEELGGMSTESYQQAAIAISKKTDLDRQLHALEQQVNILQYQQSAVAKEEIRYLEEHDDRKCHWTCEMMQQKLPRELRDMVYAYLTTYDVVEVRPGPSSSVVPVPDEKPLAEEFARRKSPPYSYRVRPQGIFHNGCTPERLGRDTLYEVTENYYRTSTFAFTCRDYIHQGELARFFTKRDPVLDVPPSSLVRNVCVHIPCAYFHLWAVPAYLYPDDTQERKTFTEASYLDFSTLLSLKPESKVSIKFETDCSWIEHVRGWTLFRVAVSLKVFLPILNRLDRKGFKLSFWVDDRPVAFGKASLTFEELLNSLEAQITKPTKYSTEGSPIEYEINENGTKQTVLQKFRA